MTTAVGITLTGICAGQNHIHLSVAVNGGQARAVTYEVDELAEPLSQDEGHRIVRDLLRLHFRGRTKAQAKTELQAGFTLVI